MRFPGRDMDRRALLRAAVRLLAALTAWAVVAVPVTVVVFLNSSRTTVLAGHQATISPSRDGYATFDLGPFLPGFRYPTSGRLGAHIDLGKTELDTYDALVNRYAFIASQPEGQIAKLQRTITEMALDSAVTGALVGAVGPGLWWLVGRRRRQEILRAVTVRRAGVGLVAVCLVGLGVARPWDQPELGVPGTSWQPVTAALPGVSIPDEARLVEVDTGLLTSGSKRLVESAFDSYRRSLTFYREAATRVPALVPQLHQPASGEVVAVLVSDRHDNIGMDPVVRAIADAGGATFLLDAGDDTSTGSSWEAFSLESLDEAFGDYDDRFAVSGNHDEGDFITKQARSLGFTTLVGEPVEGPDGVRLLGAGDPRSSGLGSWKDERAITFEEQTSRLADAACAADDRGERVTTLLVHDANAGSEALERGCVDLVVGGHLHEQVGPDRVIGANGKVGYRYTTGTTGGAAYAIAIGTKPRRQAMVSLVTYRDGSPVGIQAVALSPLGELTVTDYVTLNLSTLGSALEELRR